MVRIQLWLTDTVYVLRMAIKRIPKEEELFGIPIGNETFLVPIMKGGLRTQDDRVTAIELEYDSTDLTGERRRALIKKLDADPNWTKAF